MELFPLVITEDGDPRVGSELRYFRAPGVGVEGDFSGIGKEASEHHRPNLWPAIGADTTDIDEVETVLAVHDSSCQVHLGLSCDVVEGPVFFGENETLVCVSRQGRDLVLGMTVFVHSSVYHIFSIQKHAGVSLFAQPKWSYTAGRGHLLS